MIAIFHMVSASGSSVGEMTIINLKHHAWALSVTVEVNGATKCYISTGTGFSDLNFTMEQAVVQVHIHVKTQGHILFFGPLTGLNMVELASFTQCC